MRRRSNTQQQGTSLLELISIVTLTGVTGAAVAPKMMSLGDAAEQAKLNAAVAAVHSGATLAHANWLVEQSKIQTPLRAVMMDEELILIKNGWPAVSHIAAAAGIDCSQYGCIHRSNHMIFTANVTPTENTPCAVYRFGSFRYELNSNGTWDSSKKTCK